MKTLEPIITICLMLILSSVLLAYGNPSNMNMGGYKTANYNANLEHNLLDMDIADIMNMLKSGAKREAKRDQQQMFKKKSGPKRDQRHILHQTIGVLPSGPKTYLPQGVIPPPPYDPTLPPPYDPTTGYPLNPYETSPHIIPPDFHSIYNQPPEKLYNHPNSNQNCSVEDEIIISQICTPTQQTMCEENSVTYKKIVLKDYCYDFAQTECTESEEIIPNDVCVFDYQPKESMARATNLEVKFEKSCDKQMVTVCDPNYYHHGYEPFHSGYGTAFEAHCKEIRQEICFNAPTVDQLELPIKLTLPSVAKHCESHPITIPRISCEVKIERKCIKVPEVEDDFQKIEKCQPVITDPVCRRIELTLPKQVCQDIVYGYARKPLSR